eukprot:Gregarina_sp_Poly_1__4453@NODE_239_length_10907_cov_182_631458_g210_i0_p1_GENE_NODE_239_length_10907_cov_182_631458_g210_i0NODE_239_length_10907_cov_182_631458_g210_i0_p1_ORF_typecomplete_len729_score103_36Glyco_tranf_2_3/PF13641_6/2_2e20Glycos_transf_2/PF00535_26/5_5e19Glyco_tranf_2_2/PF10111_9/6_5e08Glyco_transf_7C/PF02709_14/1_6e07_NODE_239_length_10907_cov_182_631458_g210_i047206906
MNRWFGSNPHEEFISSAEEASSSGMTSPAPLHPASLVDGDSHTLKADTLEVDTHQIETPASGLLSSPPVLRRRVALAQSLLLFVYPAIQILWQLEFLLLGLSLSTVACLSRIASNRVKTLPFVLFALFAYSAQLLSFSGFYDLKYKQKEPPISRSAFRGRDRLSTTVDEETLRNHSLAQLMLWESRLESALHAPEIAPEKVKHGVSVVIAAYQEYEYIERTVVSILNETASLALTEVLIIDDFSEKPLRGFLGEPLLKHRRVHVKRNEDRKGLIRSKQIGGDLALGDFIVFLDGHVKPTPKWVPYLLREMVNKPSRVVVPAIPILEKDSWDVKSLAVGYKMMFDWDLAFHWFEDNNDEVPCMSGGLLGITKEWWNHTGGYDPGMRLWGSENIEQSIKTWMAGGEIVVARNSRVSHVFRQSFPYKIDYSALAANKLRLVEVWFDDWKNRTKVAKKYPTKESVSKASGSVSEQKKTRRRLAKDKTFNWYVRRFRNTFLRKGMLDLSSFSIIWGTEETPQYCLLTDDSTSLAQQSTKLRLVKECESELDNFSFRNHSWYLWGDILEVPAFPLIELTPGDGVSFNPRFVPANIVGNRYRPTLEFSHNSLCLGPLVMPRAQQTNEDWVREYPALSACKPLNPGLEFRDLRQWGGFAFPDWVNAALIDAEFSPRHELSPQITRNKVPIQWGSLCLTVVEGTETEAPTITIQLCVPEDPRQLFGIKNWALRNFGK